MKKALTFALLAALLFASTGAPVEAATKTIKITPQMMQAFKTAKEAQMKKVATVFQQMQAADPCKDLNKLKGTWQQTNDPSYIVTITVEPENEQCSVVVTNLGGYSVTFLGTKLPLTSTFQLGGIWTINMEGEKIIITLAGSAGVRQMVKK